MDINADCIQLWSSLIGSVQVELSDFSFLFTNLSANLDHEVVNVDSLGFQGRIDQYALYTCMKRINLKE